jgi:hypothetical protein
MVYWDWESGSQVPQYLQRCQLCSDLLETCHGIIYQVLGKEMAEGIDEGR